MANTTASLSRITGKTNYTCRSRWWINGHYVAGARGMSGLVQGSQVDETVEEKNVDGLHGSHVDQRSVWESCG